MHRSTVRSSHVFVLKQAYWTACVFIAEFKTPTRPARGQFRRLIPDDSPSNDFHQDIVWDTTSPSPIRHGMHVITLWNSSLNAQYQSMTEVYLCSGRGQRRAANIRAVDISDLAKRIAPKVCSRNTTLVFSVHNELSDIVKCCVVMYLLFIDWKTRRSGFIFTAVDWGQCRSLHTRSTANPKSSHVDKVKESLDASRFDQITIILKKKKTLFRFFFILFFTF